MPRRKTLRASSRRAKPEAPPGSVGEDLTGETKQEKLEVLLRDFDAEVELRVKEMKSYYEHLKSEVEKLYQFEMMKLPKAIQSMKMKDFLESGGSVNAAQLQQQHREVDELINSIKKRPLANSKAKAMPLQMETISEEKENQKMEAPKTRQRAPKTASRTAAASRRRVAAAALTTPAHTRGALTGWETPLQTPAFDPRLPQTPAVKTGQAGRKLKPGESIFLISANGSPISLDTNPVVFAPTKSGDRVQSICVLNGDDPRLLDKAGIKVG